MNSSHSVWKDSLPFYKSAYSMQNTQTFPEMLRESCDLEHITYVSQPLWKKWEVDYLVNLKFVLMENKTAKEFQGIVASDMGSLNIEMSHIGWEHVGDLFCNFEVSYKDGPQNTEEGMKKDTQLCWKAKSCESQTQLSV